MNNKIQKGFMASLLGTVIVMSSGLAVQAEMPEDFWEYDLAYDEDDNTIYEFSELEVVIPENWEDRYDVEEADDGLRFYSTAVREYCQRENPDSLGGELFTLHASQDYGFLEEPQYSYIIGSSDDYIYYLTVMQGEAYEPEDAESADDWRDLSDDREWIEEQAFVTQPGEGIVDTDQMEESAQEHADNSEVFVGEYIVPESSDRELTAEDLEGLDANELQMAINEIYARHHRKFLTKSIQEYFESKSWYTGKVEAAKFDESSLSLIEGKNIALMQQCMSSTSGSGTVGNAADTGADMSGTVANAAGTGTGISGTVENGMTLYATATVNIRSKATTESAIMGIVPQGYAVSATGSAQNGWIPVDYSGIRGYVNVAYLSENGVSQNNSYTQVETEENINSESNLDNTAANSEQSMTEDDSTVSAAVQLHVGPYKETDYFVAEGLEELPEYYELYIANVTDTSFQFTVNLLDSITGGVNETVISGTAEFSGNGQEAVANVSGSDIYFSFPDYHNAYPDVTDIVVSGIPAIEGKVMINNAVPGHGFS